MPSFFVCRFEGILILQELYAWKVQIYHLF